MFCPKCGNPNLQVNTYCRQCGIFLPDFEKNQKPETTPEQHLTANLVLSILTGVVSAFLAISLYTIFLGKENTHWVVYMTAGFLTAMFAWQVQTVWRTILLKKQIKKQRYEAGTEEISKLESSPTNELLPEADFSNVVPTSITENTTTKLKIYK